MKTLFLLTLFVTGLNRTWAATHSLRYFYTASRGIPSLPDFVTIGTVDSQPISYYDSVQRREVPKQKWMEQKDEPDYWDRLTQISIGAEQPFRASIETVSRRLNQTQGPHIVQNLYGCDWDDQTGAVHGFNQFGYNGEDYIVFNLETETWIAPRPQAVITKMRWDRDQARIQKDKTYLTHTCVDWLKKYVRDGRESLMRTEMPSIHLLQKSSSSPVTCHATGFYPDGAMLFWTKDKEEFNEGVDIWEVLPNHDGTFQMSADLDVSSIPPEDWDRYSCVFQLSGVKEDVLTKLDRAVIRTNAKNSPTIYDPLAVCVIVPILSVFGIVCVVLLKFKKKKAQKKALDFSEVKTETEAVTENVSNKALLWK